MKLLRAVTGRQYREGREERELHRCMHPEGSMDRREAILCAHVLARHRVDPVAAPKPALRVVRGRHADCVVTPTYRSVRRKTA